MQVTNEIVVCVSESNAYTLVADLVRLRDPYNLAAEFRHVTRPYNLRQSTTAFRNLKIPTLFPGPLAHEHNQKLILIIRDRDATESLRGFCCKFKQNLTNMTPQTTLGTHKKLEFQ